MKSTLFIFLISFVIGSQAGILLQDFYQQGLSSGFTFAHQASVLSASVDGLDVNTGKEPGLVAGASAIVQTITGGKPLSEDSSALIQGMLYALFVAGFAVIAGELAERYYSNKRRAF